MCELLPSPQPAPSLTPQQMRPQRPHLHNEHHTPLPSSVRFVPVFPSNTFDQHFLPGRAGFVRAAASTPASSTIHHIQCASLAQRPHLPDEHHTPLPRSVRSVPVFSSSTSDQHFLPGRASLVRAAALTPASSTTTPQQVRPQRLHLHDKHHTPLPSGVRSVPVFPSNTFDTAPPPRTCRPRVSCCLHHSQLHHYHHNQCASLSSEATLA